VNLPWSPLRALLFAFPGETSHRLTLDGIDLAARSGLLGHVVKPPAALPTRVMGIDFPNPVGLAAGLDKNGEHLDALGALGFGFIEIGTVTPRPQPGNPRPRLFRVAPARAIVNRMGFNNAGVEQLCANVRASAWRGVLGINIGKNKDTPAERAVDDYLHCLDRVHALAHYVTINLSSPNTPGLRDLQFGEPLAALLGALVRRRDELAQRHGRRVPLTLKIAPDMADEDLGAVADTVRRAGIDGLIATNTTVSRAGVEGMPNAAEAGGLSGAPLTERAQAVMRGLHARLGGELPLIGVGGIMDGAHAAERARAGADLLQLYSGLIYRGPSLVAEAVDALRNLRPA
jgi:dihydroorotate dehydrogenase